MEKFRSSADPSTGLHPFIPVARTSIPVLFLGFVFLLPLRLPLLILSLSLTILLAAISAALAILSPALARPFLRLAHRLGLRLLLLSLGVWHYSPPVLERPRSRSSPPGVFPTSGSAVFANTASYLDTLYLACALSPTFVLVAPGGRLVRASLVRAFLHAFNGAVDAPPGASSLTDLCASSLRNSGGPVVVFGEGTMSNGAGVLAFRVGIDAQCAASMFAAAMSYSPSRRETHTVGSGALHALRLMCSFQTQIRCRIAAVAPGGDIQKSVAGLAGVPALQIGAEARVRYTELLAKMGKGY